MSRTLQTLVEIRNELRELSDRMVESELRTATALTELSGTVREMTAVLRAQSELRPRLERCEQEIAAIKLKLPA